MWQRVCASVERLVVARLAWEGALSAMERLALVLAFASVSSAGMGFVPVRPTARDRQPGSVPVPPEVSVAVCLCLVS